MAGLFDFSILGGLSGYFDPDAAKRYNEAQRQRDRHYREAYEEWLKDQKRGEYGEFVEIKLLPPPT